MQTASYHPLGLTLDNKPFSYKKYSTWISADTDFRDPFAAQFAFACVQI